jgi:hypothetical protein
MSEHTDERRTDQVEIRAMGPELNKERAIEALKGLGFMDVSESVPWRDAFPEYGEKDFPGVCLRGARGKEGLTQRISLRLSSPLSSHGSQSLPRLRNGRNLS